MYRDHHRNADSADTGDCSLLAEVICGLAIALNLGARFFAILLILFVAGATFYYHDF